MKNTHHIIFVPGLGDDVKRTQFWINFWPKEKGLSFEVWSANWENYDEDFREKYNILLKKVKEQKKEYENISLIGISAGASLVGNVFAKNSNLIHKIVTVCGRLKMEKTGLPTLEWITFRNLSFINSVYEFQKNEQKISEIERKRIMTLSGMYDELVSVSTMGIDGAENKFIPFIGHNFCIILSLTLFKTKILDFLNS